MEEKKKSIRITYYTRIILIIVTSLTQSRSIIHVL